MILQKVTENNVQNILNKKICCFEYSISYLKEFCEKYDVLDCIDRIIDTNVRNQGYHDFMDRHIEVSDMKYLDHIDMAETAIVITSDYYREAYETLLSHPSFHDSDYVIYYFENRETEYEEKYREQYRNKELQDIIIFRSGPHASAYVKGMDFADNARALFEYMLDNHFNERYDLVWLVKHPEDFVRYKDSENVSFLSFDWSVSDNEEERSKYYRALCLAKYIFFTDAYGFARNSRSDQVRVQLWHGCGFKTRVNFVRCEKRYEYTTVISELYSKIHQNIYGLCQNQMLITGYAKQDWLFHPIDNVWQQLSIPKADKYIFWLPTFRRAKAQLNSLNEYELGGQLELPLINTYEMLEKLDALLAGLDIVLVLKLHPFQDASPIGKVGTENIVLLDNEKLVDMDIQINQMLGHADALISDYSSAAVDYMLLDRPIGFTLDDVDEYAKSRGFVFENVKDWLPGMELFSYDDFCTFVREIADGVDSTRNKRLELKHKMHRYHDDNNCQRIVESLSIHI